MRSGFLVPPLLLLQGAWFLAPGLLGALVLLGRKRIPAHLAVLVAALISGVIAYLAFWAYLLHRGAGLAYTAGTAVLAVAAVVALLRGDRRRLLRSADIGLPLLLMFLVALFYIGVTDGCTWRSPATIVHDSCHVSQLPGDNVLPQMFAENVAHGKARDTFWTFQGSDRPPLQAAVALQQSPLTLTTAWEVTGYQVISQLLQLLWIPALWAMCRMMRLSGRRLAIVFALCVFNGFFLLNTFFVWPKLLAGSFVLLAIGLLFPGDRRPAPGDPPRPLTGWTVGLAGLAVALAMLSHSGAVFTLVPVGVALLLPRYRPPLRQLLTIGVLAVALFGTWTAYQRLYDPPGDRLLKWHLAGQPEQDPRSFPAVLVAAYTDTPVKRIVLNKVDNVAALFYTSEGCVSPTLGPGNVLRHKEFCHVAPSLETLNVGWLVLLLPFVRRRLWTRVDPARFRLLLGVTAGALLCWVLLMFGNPPALTFAFQGSYATAMLMFLLAATVIGALPRRVAHTLVALQVLYFGVVWVALVWARDSTVTHPWSYVTLTVIGAVAVGAALLRIARWQPADALPEPTDSTTGPPHDAAAAEPTTTARSASESGGIPSATPGGGGGRS
jgi:hypothetical protein